MNKILYSLLIVFLGIITAIAIWTFILSFKIGPGIYKLTSYIEWYLWGNITTFIGSILVIKYYYYQSYRLAFFTGIIAVIASLANVSIYYITLTSGELRAYNYPTLIFYLCAILVYAVSLIFSGTRERFWLKLAGIWGLLVTLALGSAFIGVSYSKDIHLVGVFQKINQWSSIASCLINLLFIINFLDEIRASKFENDNSFRRKILATIAALCTIAALAFTIKIGTSLDYESRQQKDWQDYSTEQAQVLVKLAGGEKTFVNRDGDQLRYILIKPQNYDQRKKYPLVVCLPYGGYEAAAAESLAGIDGSTHAAFIFVPYCPEGAGWGGMPGSASLESLVYETVSGLNEPAIDNRRRYVTGVSRGGYGVWQFICARPDLFAAAIPVCGAGNPKLASKIINMPLWAFHGAKDKNVPVSGSRDIISAVRRIGGKPRYTEYPDRAHNIWDKVIETPGLWDWLFAQKRD